MTNFKEIKTEELNKNTMTVFVEATWNNDSFNGLVFHPVPGGKIYKCDSETMPVVEEIGFIPEPTEKEIEEVTSEEDTFTTKRKYTKRK